MRRLPLLTAVCCALLLTPAPSTAGTAPSATWQRLDTGRGGPSARADAALAATGTNVAYLHGGERNGRALGDLWRLDVKRQRWTRLRPTQPPAARFGHDLVARANGNLLLFGGQSGDDFFGDVWHYDVRRNRWDRLTAGGAGPAPRYGAGVAIDRPRGILYVTHGFTTDGRFDDTWALPGDFFEDVSAPAGSRPLERCLVGAAFHDGGLFMFGGQSDSRPFLDDLWRYDVASRTWQDLRPSTGPSARNSYGSAVLGGRWFIHGGATRRGVARDLWLVDLAEPGAFTRVRTRGSAPAARANHAMTGLGRSRALVVGGSAGDGEQLRDAWLLRVR